MKNPNKQLPQTSMDYLFPISQKKITQMWKSKRSPINKIYSKVRNFTSRTKKERREMNDRNGRERRFSRLLVESKRRKESLKETSKRKT